MNGLCSACEIRPAMDDGFCLACSATPPEQLRFEDVEPVTQRPARTLARTSDPSTSRIAALSQRRRGTNLRKMLDAYAQNSDLTDVEASELAGLERVEATRRASELRGAGLIEPLHDQEGKLVTRILPTNRPGMVCRITEAGRAV